MQSLLRATLTLNATGAELELLSFNVSVTSLLKGPDSMLDLFSELQKNRHTPEA